jgi:hypothetical protein
VSLIRKMRRDGEMPQSDLKALIECVARQMENETASR